MTLHERLDRLYEIADQIRRNSLSDENRDFIAGALEKISEGKSPDVELEVKAKRGERKSLPSRRAKIKTYRRKKLAMAWIATAILPEPDGKGLQVEEACLEAARLFFFSAESLKSFRGHDEAMRMPTFEL